MLGVTALPALAANGGVSGKVVDANGHPVAGVHVAIFALPLKRTNLAIATLTTDRHGSFTDLALEPGPYVVSSIVSRERSGCELGRVFDGAVTRMTLHLGSKPTCTGPRFHTAIVNPALTADENVIR